MKKKKSFKVLVLSILTIMCTVLAVPGFASADAADGEAAADYFPTVNSASIDFPITLNVEPKSSDTGFFTSENVSDKTPSVSILLPVTICIVASILAYVVLRQVKAFRQKNSESLELSSADMPRILLMTKNPALLLAVCFGFGCAVPTFFLQANISRAGAEKVTDLDYETTNFQTYVDKKENPYKIAIDYEYNHSFKESKTDKELVGEAEAAKPDNQPKSERKIEDNGEFIVGSVDISFTTYNPNGFFADYGMKSGVKYNTIDEKESLEKCYEKTNLVNGKNKIPSITKAMTKAEFEKLDTAAWGWSDDGETYYPLYWSGSSDEPDNNKNQTIYFAIKLTSNTPAGAYQSSDNFQIYAENNKLTNDMFGKYQLNYNNDGEDMEIPNQSKLFLKTNPGMLDITNVIPDDHDECKKFLGWSRDDSAEDKTLYNGNDDKNNKFKVTVAMIKEAEKKASDEDGGPISVATLNSKWESTNEGCKTYNIKINQSFEFAEFSRNDDTDEPEDQYDINRKKYCTDIEEGTDCSLKYEDVNGVEHSVKEDLYKKVVESISHSTTNEEYKYKLEAPELKGYTFLGWNLYDCAETTGCVPTVYNYNQEEKKFSKDGETAAVSEITLEARGEITKKQIILTARWQMNNPILKIEFYDEDDSLEYTWSSETYEYGKWLPTDKEEYWSGRIPNGGIRTLYDFGALPDGTWQYENGDEADKALYITIEDLKTSDGDNRPVGTVKYYKL